MSDAPLRDRARTRERILIAAQDLLGDQASRELKVRDIARRAGVSPSLVVQYFESKDALVLDIGMRRLSAPMPDLADDADLPTTLDWMLNYDHGNTPMLRDLMRQSWWWSAASERAFARAMEIRVTAFGRALGDAALGSIALAAYFAELRRGLTLNQGRDAIRAAALHALQMIGSNALQLRN